jgi:hypothetical protein
MKLTGMMAALGRFISKLGEKGQPFFKLSKKSNKFEWTDETDQVLEELKTFLTTPSIMVPPTPKETLLLYISVSTQVVNAVLVAKRREEGHQYLVQRPVQVLATSEDVVRSPHYVAQAATLLPVAQDQGHLQLPSRRNLTQPRHRGVHCQVVSRVGRIRP